WKLLGYSAFDRIPYETSVAAVTRCTEFLIGKGYDVLSIATLPNAVDPHHPSFALQVRVPVVIA
ncbi:MAG TPA: hypothetical protein VM513_18455, partial [Kofleriaceae bacterium]|nr:hypothetical protein [Kofleriaceae bacterium]